MSLLCKKNKWYVFGRKFVIVTFVGNIIVFIWCTFWKACLFFLLRDLNLRFQKKLFFSLICVFIFSMALCIRILMSRSKWDRHSFSSLAVEMSMCVEPFNFHNRFMYTFKFCWHWVITISDSSLDRNLLDVIAFYRFVITQWSKLLSE